MMKYGAHAGMPVAIKIFSLYSHRERKRKRNPTRREKRKERRSMKPIPIILVHFTKNFVLIY